MNITYAQIIEAMEQNERLKRRIQKYFENKRPLELISVAEAARRYGMSYHNMHELCLSNEKNEKYPFVRRIKNRLKVQPAVFESYLRGEKGH